MIVTDTAGSQALQQFEMRPGFACTDVVAISPLASLERDPFLLEDDFWEPCERNSRTQVFTSRPLVA